MSEAELFMPDSNQNFDLPRWQTQVVDSLSSSSQAAHAAQSGYHYPAQPPSSQGPPPPSLNPGSAQRLQPLHQTPTGPARHRMSQLIDDQQHSPISSPYTTSSSQNLSRSASLSGGAVGNTPSSRARRHHQPEDLEGPFNFDSQARQPTQLLHTPFYPPNAPYQQQSHTGPGALNASAGGATDSFSDSYYSSTSSQQNKRPQDPTSPTRSSRSPLRGPGISNPSMDSYAQQAQYSPTTQYSYAPNSEQQQRSQAGSYHAHNRSQSNVKTEPMSPSMSAPYTPQTAVMHSSTPFSANYHMDTSSPHPPQIQTHLTAQHSLRQNASNPPTPLSYLHSQSPAHFYSQDQAMAVDSPPQRRRIGFRRIQSSHELSPRPDVPKTGRRMGADGTYLSPLRQLTTSILDTYRICNPQFRYESTHNPRRVLTKPSKPAHNEGYDNDDYDYILYVNDWLGTEEGHKYLILDILGQGTFGQVVKCQNMKTHEIVAVKVVKNKPAYFNQSMMEVTILEMLNKNSDPNDEHHILRLRDSFIHRNHLCLVFELLSSNLYELIKQNQFQGLSTQLVKVFMAQLLDALTVLKEARLIHCDLKPENILLKSLQSPQIKVIDFGSACHERQTVYTYIQSRFYRSPEVLLGMSYTAAIDMWSLGCIAVELFLGLPLFPGTSEYNQLTRIVEMLGNPPLSMLNVGKQTNQFFDSHDVYNPQSGQTEKKYRLKSLEQYSREHNTNEQPGKQYFKATTLPDIINTAPMPTSKSSRSAHEVEKELNNRAAFIDFCQGLLDLNPITRWTPQQARLHPFITGDKFTKPFVPDGIQQQQPVTPTTDPKRPYGGLVPSQPKGTRAYQDAAAYNQHLAQHQVYTAQAQQQAASTYPRNPYMAPNAVPQQQQPRQQQQQQPSSTAFPSTAPESLHPGYQKHNAQYGTTQGSSQPHRLLHQTSTGQLGMNNAYPAQNQQLPPNPQAHLNPSNTGNAYNPGSRARANTINQMKEIPPALARLHRMDNIPRDALTPVLNRDDPIQEWERRQTAKQGQPSQAYPQIEYLQQQAEMAAASGSLNWAQASNRYPPQPSKLSHSYQPQTILVDDENGRREMVMSNVRNAAARNDGFSTGAGVISNPPQAYTGSGTTTGNRYPAAYGQPPPPPPQQQSAPPFEAMDRRSDINAYVPMQPDQYQGYPSGSQSVAIPPQTLPPSFYGAGVVPSGQPMAAQGGQRNPFPVQDGLQSLGSAKDNRPRGAGGSMDSWNR